MSDWNAGYDAGREAATKTADAKLRRLGAALPELTHHGDLTPAGKRMLEQIIGGVL